MPPVGHDTLRNRNVVRMISAAGMKLSAIVRAHRTGQGVPWDDFGDDMRESQGDMNRPFFENLLADFELLCDDGSDTLRIR